MNIYYALSALLFAGALLLIIFSVSVYLVTRLIMIMLSLDAAMLRQFSTVQIGRQPVSQGEQDPQAEPRPYTPQEIINYMKARAPSEGGFDAMTDEQAWLEEEVDKAANLTGTPRDKLLEDLIDTVRAQQGDKTLEEPKT